MEKMGNRGVDLTGQRFGKLLVLHRDTEKQSGPGKHIYWICQCDCGKIVSKAGHHLRSGEAFACSFACKNAIPIGTEFGDLTVIE